MRPVATRAGSYGGVCHSERGHGWSWRLCTQYRSVCCITWRSRHSCIVLRVTNSAKFTDSEPVLDRCVPKSITIIVTHISLRASPYAKLPSLHYMKRASPRSVTDSKTPTLTPA